MFSLRKQRSAQGRDRVTMSLRRLMGRVLNWFALVGTTVTILMFISVGASQACPSENGAALDAAPVLSVAAPTATQSVTNSPAAAKLTVNHNFCCGRGLKHSHSPNCPDACCPACSAGITTAGSAGIQDFVLQFENPPAQTGVSSAELNTQFRPPRLSL
jgi:hypothetical protein